MLLLGVELEPTNLEEIGCQPRLFKFSGRVWIVDPIPLDGFLSNSYPNCSGVRFQNPN
jgi:hypothetical protein